MACEKHGYTNNVLCPACDLESVERHLRSKTSAQWAVELEQCPGGTTLDPGECEQLATLLRASLETCEGSTNQGDSDCVMTGDWPLTRERDAASHPPSCVCYTCIQNRWRASQKANAEPSCNPCIQWDEDGLCVTCGASYPENGNPQA